MPIDRLNEVISREYYLSAIDRLYPGSSISSLVSINNLESILDVVPADIDKVLNTL